MAEASRGVKFEAAKKEFPCVTSSLSLPLSIVPCIDPRMPSFYRLGESLDHNDHHHHLGDFTILV